MPTHYDRRSVLNMGAALAAGTALGLPRSARAQGRAILNSVVAQEPGMLACGIVQIDGAQTISGGKILQSLIRYDEENRLEGELAESWSVSPDGLVYTFNLRRGVLWHDGQPFTADDVVFSFDQILRQTHARTRSAIQKVASFAAPDPHTVVMTLEAPFLPFLTAINSVNGPILPRHLYEGTDFLQNPANNAPVGTGPFRFSEWRRGEFVHLVRFDGYWNPGEPKVDEIYFQIIPDSSQRAIAVETGRIDVCTRITITSTDQNRLVAAGHAKLADARSFDGLSAASQLFFNFRVKPFDDVRVRRAMTHALDRELIIDVALLGQARVQHGPIASSTLYHDADALVRYEHDPDRARALLAEAGIAPGALSFELLVASAGSDRARMMEIIAQQYREVGIDARVQFVDIPTLLKRGGDWDFEVVFTTVGQFQHPTIGLARNFLTSRINNTWGNNIGGYSNPRVDELWAQADAALSDAEAQGFYSEIQRLITEDVPCVFLMELQDYLVVRPNIEDIYQGPLSAYYSWAELRKL